MRTRHFSGDRAGSRHGEAGIETEIFTVINNIREIARELQAPMAQIALAWILTRPEITCVLAGIRTVKQLEENIAGVELQLSPDVVGRLDQLTEPLLKKLGPCLDYYQASHESRTY